MKKSIMLAAAAILYATTISYSQTTGTGSGTTNKPTEQGQHSKSATKTHQGNAEKGSDTPAGNAGVSKAAGQGGSAGAAQSGSEKKSGSAAQSGGAGQSGGASQSGSAAQSGSAGQSGGAAQSGNTGNVDTRSKQAQQNTPGDGSTRPGGASNDNANDVGRYSDSNSENEKSMLNSKEALDARKKNMTEADTTMKKGSGSAPKNTKNHTGKTGNYQNQEIKHNQRTPTRP